MKELAGQIGEKLADDILNADQSDEAGIFEQRERIEVLAKDRWHKVRDPGMNTKWDSSACRGSTVFKPAQGNFLNQAGPKGLQATRVEVASHSINSTTTS